MRNRTAASRRWELLTLLLAGVVLLAGGCKTTKDATAAAAQMATTAKALGDYYTAIDASMVETDHLLELQQAIDGLTYSDEARKQIAVGRDEIGKRAAMAKSLTEVAQSFSALASSTSASDASTAAGKLETQVESLQPLESEKDTLTTGQKSALKDAVHGVMLAIQAHKEREAANNLDGVADHLAKLFAAEEPYCASREKFYLVLASSEAKRLKKKGMIDASQLLKPALDPFGLAPAAVSGELKDNLELVAEKQIESKAAELEKSHQKAAEAMQTSLDEMARRIHRVATDQPLGVQMPPLTVALVEQWATQVISYFQ